MKRHIGRIDFLARNGKVMESVNYTDPKVFLEAVKKENYYGAPMIIVLYRDEKGKTISQDFLKEMDPLPQGFRIEDDPTTTAPICVIRDGAFCGLFSPKTGRELPCQLLDYDNFSQAEEGSEEYQEYQRLEYLLTKRFEEKLSVPKNVLDRINRYLALPSGLNEDEYQGDHTITYTVEFANGYQADVKCCGCRDESSWTEMVLFNKDGAELTCTEPKEEFAGTWELTYDGVTYVVVVEAA